MARIRTIKPKFWDDVKIGKLSRDARLLYIGMWNFSDDLGVIVGDPIWLKSKIFPYDQIQLQQLEKYIQELVKLGFISHVSVESDTFYYLPKFTRHQVINKPNYDDVFICKELLDKELQKNHESITEQSRNNTVTLQSYKGKEEEIDRNNKRNKKESLFDEDFEKFRSVYPGRKRGHDTEFENLKKRHKDWENIIPLLLPAIQHEIDWHNAKKNRGEWAPEYKNLSTWINGRCWELEFEKEHPSIGGDTSRVPLGLGVWIEDGKKFYGSRDHPREIPLNAPYRPSQDAKWDATNERWTISGG